MVWKCQVDRQHRNQCSVCIEFLTKLLLNSNGYRQPVTSLYEAGRCRLLKELLAIHFEVLIFTTCVIDTTISILLLHTCNFDVSEKYRTFAVCFKTICSQCLGLLHVFSKNLTVYSYKVALPFQCKKAKRPNS